MVFRAATNSKNNTQNLFKKPLGRSYIRIARVFCKEVVKRADSLVEEITTPEGKTHCRIEYSPMS